MPSVQKAIDFCLLWLAPVVSTVVVVYAESLQSRGRGSAIGCRRSPPSGGHPIPHPHPSACLDSVVPQAPSHAWCQTRSGKLSGRTIQGYHMAVARKPRKALPVSPALVLVGGRHNTRLGGRHSNQITFNSIPLEKFSKLIGIVDPSQSKDQLNPLGSDIRGKGENPWVSEGKKR